MNRTLTNLAVVIAICISGGALAACVSSADLTESDDPTASDVDGTPSAEDQDQPADDEAAPPYEPDGTLSDI